MLGMEATVKRSVALFAHIMEIGLSEARGGCWFVHLCRVWLTAPRRGHCPPLLLLLSFWGEGGVDSAMIATYLGCCCALSLFS